MLMLHHIQTHTAGTKHYECRHTSCTCTGKCGAERSLEKHASVHGDHGSGVRVCVCVCLCSCMYLCMYLCPFFDIFVFGNVYKMCLLVCMGNLDTQHDYVCPVYGCMPSLASLLTQCGQTEPRQMNEKHIHRQID